MYQKNKAEEYYPGMMQMQNDHPLIMHTARFMTSGVTPGSWMGKARREESGSLLDE